MFHCPSTRPCSGKSQEVYLWLCAWQAFQGTSHSCYGSSSLCPGTKRIPQCRNDWPKVARRISVALQDDVWIHNKPTATGSRQHSEPSPRKAWPQDSRAQTKDMIGQRLVPLSWEPQSTEMEVVMLLKCECRKVYKTHRVNINSWDQGHHHHHQFLELVTDSEIAGDPAIHHKDANWPARGPLPLNLPTCVVTCKGHIVCSQSVVCGSSSGKGGIWQLFQSPRGHCYWANRFPGNIWAPQSR